jgi:hypothetical protein
MGQQKEITTAVELLNNKGMLNEPGWARQPLWIYNRNEIKASPLRIKEWDYYYVLSDDLKRGITFTLAQLYLVFFQQPFKAFTAAALPSID